MNTRLPLTLPCVFGLACLLNCSVAPAIECSTGDPFCNPLSATLLQLVRSDSNCTSLVAGTIHSCTGPLELSGTVSTVAGSGVIGTADGIGTSAVFGAPFGMTTDGSNLYFAQLHSQRILKMNIASTAVTTLAGSSAGFADGASSVAQFSQPRELMTDGVYVFQTDASNHRIRRITLSTGDVSTLAGQTTFGTTDAVGTAAQFRFPQGITTDGTYLYISDGNNNLIRRINIDTANVTTLAGSGAAGHADGTGTAATFQAPWGMTMLDGYLYVCDTTRHLIRRIDPTTAVVTTIAGQATVSGTDDGIGTSARFNRPVTITNDGYYLYIADQDNHAIRKLDPATHAVTTIAGQSGTNGYADGSPGSALFDTPRGIVSDGLNLYVADSLNFRIRKIE